ncbi:immunity protein YezG family protein [Shouchella lonarensis]|uniref:Antitoxin YezG n=1 Tax=Shouchella lonarensis TaxID=1464122 RepID=A0A1G6HAL6_9BACI|nr:immunity protein YezG family protein [Shouchella lonarensis]SDB90975.1 conserved hypothetical protein [Shouchella lonarensis]
MSAQVESYYQQMANLIVDMIPEDWQEVKLYAESRRGYQGIFFYYFSNEKDEWVYYMDIPEKCDVPQEEFDNLNTNLSFCIKDFKNDYEAEFEEPWTGFQLTLSHNGNFNVHFNYDENSLDPMLTEVAWAYEQLGLVPSEDSFNKTLLDEYLEEKEKGKRYPFLEPVKEE